MADKNKTLSTPSKTPSQKSLLLDMPKEKPKEYSTANPNFDKNYEYFHVMDHDEPHAIRRKQILEKHPEIEELFTRDRTSIYLAIFFNILQFLIVWFLSNIDLSWGNIILVSFLVGALINHALFILIHDITHFTCFQTKLYNQLFGIIANLPQIIPTAISFGRYHADHHAYFGDAVNDPDLPHPSEMKIFNTWYKKLFFICTMPISYALRPYFKKPKLTSFMEALNIVCNFAYGYMIFKYFGIKQLVYLTLGTLMGLSIHPIGAHIIAEHFEFYSGQDTYSYYGWMNYLNFNVGYHVEHHDFPNISWTKLPMVTKIAPEFYENLPQVDSYITVVFKYIFEDSMGPWSRIALGENSKPKKE